MKVLYIPLDERPCNYKFPSMIAGMGEDISFLIPPMALMGDKKTPGDTKALWQFVKDHAKEVDAMILSIDTLIYGGIVPSRLHYLTEEACVEAVNELAAIKKAYPIPIYAFSLIMRCPTYSLSDEEPDYYEDYGREIFRKGYISHRKDLGIATNEEIDELDQIEAILPQEVWEDYVSRRMINCKVNQRVIELVKEEVIDFLIIPQDDASPYGLTALDQQRVREHIERNNVELKVYMYPGADEVGCTLLARLCNTLHGKKPLMYPKFMSAKGELVIPSCEDRLLLETVKYQILAAGCLVATSASEADIILMLNSPGERMITSTDQDNKEIANVVFRNIIEAVEYTDYMIHDNKKPVIMADVAYGNGADLKLIKLLRQKGLLFKVAAFAGWNTSSNAMGTAIAQGIFYSIYGDSKAHRDFLALRYLEDGGYCSVVRRQSFDAFGEGQGFTWFQIDGERGTMRDCIKERLEAFAKEHLDTPEEKIVIKDVYMPWRRMFEVGLEVEYEEVKRVNG